MRRLALLPCLLLAACVSIPAGALQPARTYTPRVERLSVAGFRGQEWAETGSQVGSVASPNLGLYGYSVGVSGQIVPTDDSAAMRYALENTRCIDVVEEGMAPNRLEGTSTAADRTGFVRLAVTIVEAFTLLPVFGLPVPDRVAATATGRLYLSGRPVKDYAVERQFPYWTIVYSDRARSQALALVSGTALRDLADQVAADLCGGRVLGVSVEPAPAP